MKRPGDLYDTIVVGGGIMGSTVALRLAQGGQRVALLERGGLCMQASGVNAGTLSIQIKRAGLIPYAMKGWDLWRNARDWLGADAGFEQVGGLTLAFTEEEAEKLTAEMQARQEAGAPIELIGPNHAREIEPGLSDMPILAAYCAMDGYAASYKLGDLFRAALERAGVHVREAAPVDGIDQTQRGYAARIAQAEVHGSRIVLAGGAWLEDLLARDFGISIRIECRVNQVSVTERMPPIMQTVISSARGLLTLKQSENGTVLIGGGWQGKGDPASGGYEIVPDNLVGNLRLACHAVPALRQARILRTWLGVEGITRDVMPIVGELPGAPGAYVIGCARGGYTIGPYLGALLAQRILGREPEMPLFDPARVVVASQED